MHCNDADQGALPAVLRFGFGIMLTLLSACKSETPEVPQTVIVEPAVQRDFPVYGDYVATTRASLDIEVRARVDGFITEIAFTEGSVVEEGDILYRIDDRPYRARVQRLNANVQRAQAEFDKAKRDVARLQPLYEQDAASQLDLDNALAERDQSRASLAATKAELEEAQLELEYTEIRAPIKGLVGATSADIGALVGSSGQSLLTTVKRVDPMFIEFHMSSLDYINARRRKATQAERKEQEEQGRAVEGFVRITLPDNSLYRYWGDVSFTDPQVNPATGTFTVRAVVANPQRELLPGLYTKARLELDSIENAILIHEKAIQIDQGGSYVMVAMPDNRVERRFIVTGHHDEQWVVVRSGLGKGERVITEGYQKVRHGQLVEAISPTEYAARQAEEASKHAPDSP